MYGIYYLKINGKYYIGKDVQVSNLKRIKEHMWMLKSGTHYNRYLQAAYCKYEFTLEYGVLEEIECSLEELSEIEQQYIWQYDSYNNGYNLTLGGEGLGGIKFTEEQLEKKRQRVIGEKIHNPKLQMRNFLRL